MKEHFKKVTESKNVKAVIVGVVGFAVVLAIFQAGVFVGFHKASFLFKGGDNFYRAFGDADDRSGNGGVVGVFKFKDEFTGGHGAIGKIVRVNLPTFVVIGPDNIEKIVLTNDDTEVRKQRDISAVTDLAADQFITVLGSPNDQGQIVAKFIRVLPPPTSNSPPMPPAFSTSSQFSN